jgi:hypothetical protein
MGMAFWIGSVYKFVGKQGEITLKFLEEGDEDYLCEMREGNMVPEGELGQSKRIFKSSVLLTQYQWLRIADEGLTLAPNDPVVQEKRKKRTKDEIEVDNLIEHVQRTIKMNELWEQINEALDNDNYELFIRLSKEYAKLKRKVSA